MGKFGGKDQKHKKRGKKGLKRVIFGCTRPGVEMGGEGALTR